MVRGEGLRDGSCSICLLSYKRCYTSSHLQEGIMSSLTPNQVQELPRIDGIAAKVKLDPLTQIDPGF